MPALVVVVNTDNGILRRTERALYSPEYSVVALPSYGEALRLLQSVSPDLLVADIRLGSFNGLQLAILCRFDHPDVPVIITHVREDPIFEVEAKRHGAEFLTVAPEDPAFLARVEMLLTRRRREQQGIRRWSRNQVAGGLQVQVADAQARVLDLSYGGVRLAFSDEAEIPLRFEIRLSPSEVPIQAHRVWTAQASDHELWCGAEVEEGGGHWRELVKSFESGAAL